MIVYQTSIDGTVAPPRPPSRTSAVSISQQRTTPLHALRSLSTELEIGDPSGALATFEEALAAKESGRDRVTPAKALASASRATQSEEARRLRAEHRQAQHREADRLYQAARKQLAEHGDAWIDTLRPVVDEALEDPNSRASEQRFTAAYSLHRELIRQRAVATVSARWSPWLYLIANMPEAFCWQLLNHPTIPRQADIAAEHSKPRPISLNTSGQTLPRPDDFHVLARHRKEWGVSLYTAHEVIDHWRSWPKPEASISPHQAATAAFR